MKMTIRELRNLISETINKLPTGDKRTATVHMGHAGRYIEIDNEMLSVTDAAYRQNEDLYQILDDDEDEYNRIIRDVEDEILKNYNITHIIDSESFGDDAEHSVEEYMDLDNES